MDFFLDIMCLALAPIVAANAYKNAKDNRTVAMWVDIALATWFLIVGLVGVIHG